MQEHIPDPYKFKNRATKKLNELKRSFKNKTNLEYALDFINKKKGDGRKDGTVVKYCEAFEWMNCNIDKNFRKITEPELRQIVADIQDSSMPVHAKDKILTIMKPFFEFLAKKHNGKATMDDIILQKPETEKVDPEDLISPEQIVMLIDPNVVGSLKSLRMRCFVSLLYECALRPSEAILLRRSDIRHMEDGSAILHVPKEGKTGERFVPIRGDTGSLQLLEDYFKSYNRKPEDFLFGHNGEYLSYAYARKKFEQVTQDVLGRKRKLYIPRHSRGTYWLDQGVPAEIIEQWMGHSPNGTTFKKYYLHLSRKQTTDWMMKLPTFVGCQPVSQKPAHEIATSPQITPEILARALQLLAQMPKENPEIARPGIGPMSSRQQLLMTQK